MNLIPNDLFAGGEVRAESSSDFATVVEVQENGVRLRLDGEETAGAKVYQRLSSYGRPAVGDRVYIARVGGSVLVLGSIGGSSSGGGAGWNVFFSETEPAVAEGVWVKTTAEGPIYLVPDAENSFQSEKSTMVSTTARYLTSSCAVGSKVLIAGGVNAAGSAVLGTVEAIDVDTNILTALTPISGRFDAASAAHNGLAIFACGGNSANNGTSVVEAIDATSNIRTSLTAFRACVGARMAVRGNTAYLFGGCGAWTGAPTNSLEALDLTTGIKTAITASTVRARAFFGMCTVDNRLIMMGGYTGANHTGAIGDVEELYVLGSTATAKPITSIRPRGLPAACELLGFAAIGGGANDGRTVAYGHVEVIDVRNGKVNALTSITPRYGLGAAAIGDKAVFSAGSTNASWTGSVGTVEAIQLTLTGLGTPEDAYLLVATVKSPGDENAPHLSSDNALSAQIHGVYSRQAGVVPAAVKTPETQWTDI